ncbi:MAG: hypothetical protein LBR64_00505 [Dysgonamonadaceae bacterium]|jgi:hypothetical protein|nr:hypothetical protein [Dysgonamonadaceae bacterium]
MKTSNILIIIAAVLITAAVAVFYAESKRFADNAPARFKPEVSLSDSIRVVTAMDFTRILFYGSEINFLVEPSHFDTVTYHISADTLYLDGNNTNVNFRSQVTFDARYGSQIEIKYFNKDTLLIEARSAEVKIDNSSVKLLKINAIDKSIINFYDTSKADSAVVNLRNGSHFGYSGDGIGRLILDSDNRK